MAMESLFISFLIFHAVAGGLFENSEPHSGYNCHFNGVCYSKYRTIDGSCNNLENPTWGKVDTPYSRLFPEDYNDGFSSIDPNSPNAREMSLDIFSLGSNFSCTYSVMMMPILQMAAHDTAGSFTQGGSCCLNGKAVQSDVCASIDLSSSDPDYGPYNRTCMAISRTRTTKTINCQESNRADQMSAVTHFFDLSTLYGSTDETSIRLRTHEGGQLRAVVTDGQQFCLHQSTPFCHPESFCYDTGDVRASQNLGLSAVQVLFLREHNRIAVRLQKCNPLLSDEILFQIARSINIAKYQHIVEELISMVLGSSFTDIEYDPNINPSTISESTSCCFRLFHSIIREIYSFLNEDGTSNGNVTLTRTYERPIIVEQHMKELLLGFTAAPMEELDQYTVPGVLSNVEKKSNLFGDSLMAIDEMRSRDFGTAKYATMRDYICGTKTVKFSDLEGAISKENIKKLQKYYKSVYDVGCYFGNAVEQRQGASLLGPTCTAILEEQFRRWKGGDRYYYSHPGVFTESQLREIKKASLSDLICRNEKNINALQRNSFLLPSENNPVVSCSEIPSPSICPWRNIH